MQVREAGAAEPTRSVTLRSVSVFCLKGGTRFRSNVTLQPGARISVSTSSATRAMRARQTRRRDAILHALRGASVSARRFSRQFALSSRQSLFPNISDV